MVELRPSKYVSPEALFEFTALEFYMWTVTTSFGATYPPGHPEYVPRKRLMERWECVAMWGRFVEKTHPPFETDFCSNLWNKALGLVFAVPEMNGVCVSHDLFWWYARWYDTGEAWWGMADKFLATMVMRHGRQHESKWKRPIYWARAFTHRWAPTVMRPVIRWWWARKERRG